MPDESTSIGSFDRSSRRLTLTVHMPPVSASNVRVDRRQEREKEAEAGEGVDLMLRSDTSPVQRSPNNRPDGALHSPARLLDPRHGILLMTGCSGASQAGHERTSGSSRGSSPESVHASPSLPFFPCLVPLLPLFPISLSFPPVEGLRVPDRLARRSLLYSSQTTITALISSRGNCGRRCSLSA